MYPHPSSRTRIALIALAAISPLAAFPATAQSPPKPQRLSLCAACHGESGIAVETTTPNLAGQNLDYLRSAVQQYRTGARNFPAMRAALGMLTAADLDRVLQWYAAQRPATVTATE